LAIWLAIATGISLLSPNICHTFSRTVAEEFFEPFVIATIDGSAIAVDSPKRVLLGERTFAVADRNRRMDTIPYRIVVGLNCRASSLGGRVETFFSSLGIW
jgi:hypothetical protein